MHFRHLLSALLLLLGHTEAVRNDDSFENWAHGRVQLPHTSIHFRYAGSGPPLLLVHGNPQHSVRCSHSG